MNDSARYLFVVCQVGAERVLKSEVSRQWPALRLSYSRPGFVTFKWTGEDPLPEDFDLRSTFARAHGFSLGRVVGAAAESLAADAWQLVGQRRVSHIHAWQRDAATPGHRGFEPGASTLSAEVAERIAAAMPSESLGQRKPAVNSRARPGELVLDCVLVEPNEWFVGYHQALSVPSRYPGGVCLLRRGDETPISRAYWKMREALVWSQMPLAWGDRCVEIGSAPGGASQALLEAGLHVVGIDPAEMDESLLDHPRFTHVKKRAADLKRREFRGVRWLMADSNLAPDQTLKMVEEIVTHREVHVRGMLLTLKLPEWELADQIPEFIARVRSWGYRYVRTRQLAFNRQEICLAALRDRTLRRTAGPRKSKRRPASSPPTPEELE